MRLKVYVYENCLSCEKALRFLDEHDIDYFTVPIREKPPTRGELKRMMRHYGGNIRRLFNTSGMDYQHLKLKDRLRFMPEGEALELLTRNGNLVKRPFVLTKDNGLIGFRQDEWVQKLLK